jgi:predicted RNase H-like nuclease (RuvC/YqgF family)
MYKRPLIILGIDPGNTLGYSILSIDGKLIKCNSSRTIDFSLLIKEIISYGKVIAVGCDKKKAPDFVYDFSVKVGALLISPKEDLLVNEKKEMVKGYNFEDSHQLDSLASAIFAYNSLKNIILKIENYVKKNNLLDIKEDILFLVIKNRIPISVASDILSKKDEFSREKKIIYDELNKNNNIKFNDDSNNKNILSNNNFSKILFLYNSLRNLKDKNDYLKNKIRGFEEKYAMQVNINKILSSKLSKDYKEERKDKKINEHKKFSGILEKEIKQLNIKNEYLEKVNNYYKDLLFSLNDNVIIIPKFNNLSSKNINVLKKYNFKERPIIVNNPMIYSDSSLDYLSKNKIIIISALKYPKKIIDLKEVILLSISKIKIINELDDFLVLDKNSFLREKNSYNLIEKIVDDYIKDRINDL